jgi:hypothetical protein
MLFIPEQDLGMALLFNSYYLPISSAYSDTVFDVALLALGHEAQNYPLREDWVTRHTRPLAAALILALLTGVWIALRRLRSGAFSRRDVWLFIGLAIVDLALVSYALFYHLPNNESSVPVVVRFEPDLGLMLIIILLLTAGWGSMRSL